MPGSAQLTLRVKPESC